MLHYISSRDLSSTSRIDRLIALLLSSMRRSRSDATDVHSKTRLAAEESPKYKMMRVLLNLAAVDGIYSLT